MLVLAIVMFVTAALGIVGVAVSEGRQRRKDAARVDMLNRCMVSGIVHEPSEARRLAELQKRVRRYANERIVSDSQQQHEGTAA